MLLRYDFSVYEGFVYPTLRLVFDPLTSSSSRTSKHQAFELARDLVIMVPWIRRIIPRGAPHDLGESCGVCKQLGYSDILYSTQYNGQYVVGRISCSVFY
jgi:hypothetical protein